MKRKCILKFLAFFSLRLASCDSGRVEILQADASDGCSGPVWQEFSGLLRDMVGITLKEGCSCVPDGEEQIFVIGAHDSGFEDHAFRVKDAKALYRCQDSGKARVYRAALESKDASVRHVVFAAQGCLVNRETWGRVHDLVIGPRIAIASDCAVARLYRPGMCIR